MLPPPGFRTNHLGQVCRLQKSLHGLRKVSRCWFSKLTSALRHFDFVQSYAAYSLLTYHMGNVYLRVLVYVDNLLITSNFIQDINKFKVRLSSIFIMKD